MVLGTCDVTRAVQVAAYARLSITLHSSLNPTPYTYPPSPSSLADPVGQADFCFMKGATKGQLATLTFSDSDHHCVPLVYALLLDSENFSSWRQLLLFAKEHYPGLDSAKFRLISDQDKGGEKAMRSELVHGQSFFCSYHREENVRGGEKAKSLFVDAVSANTMAELQRLKQQQSATAQTYLARVPDARQYIGGRRPYAWSE